jgi:hypothetical protein
MLDAIMDELQPTSFHIVPGSHHFHADPGTANAVAHHTEEFLN